MKKELALYQLRGKCPAQSVCLSHAGLVFRSSACCLFCCSLAAGALWANHVCLNEPDGVLSPFPSQKPFGWFSELLSLFSPRSFLCGGGGVCVCIYNNCGGVWGISVLKMGTSTPIIYLFYYYYFYSHATKQNLKQFSVLCKRQKVTFLLYPGQFWAEEMEAFPKWTTE